jgi:NAD(P)-dependent dehydrogenase (short-subunit alcohol dehydrogenase family)
MVARFGPAKQRRGIMSGAALAKVCFVSGGASGLGRATAMALAKQYRIAVADRDEAAGTRVVGEIADAGGEAAFFPLDVTREADVRAAIDNVVARFGGLHCAVNCAGVEGDRQVTGEYPIDEWRRVIDINLNGVFACLKYQLQAMVRGGGGTIVNVGSTASLRAVPRMSAYVAAKHALVGLTKCAALEYADKGIRVNLLCPGSFHTPMSERLYGPTLETAIARTPMKRMAPPSEIADAIVWLCSEQSSFVTGTAVTVDGGKLAGIMM